MIPIIPVENDDAGFLSLIQRILNGAVAETQTREVYLVQIDNWFDHKWLGWHSRWSHKAIAELRVPSFNPNRVCSEKHFACDMDSSAWNSIDMPAPLHIRQQVRRWAAKPIEQISKSAAFAWYSGNTEMNKVGSLMFYLTGPDLHAWYASCQKSERWVVTDEFHITKGELKSFEERGLQLELAQTQSLDNS